MKLILLGILLLSISSVFADEQVNDDSDQIQVITTEQSEEKFTDTEVGGALEAADTTLDQIGRDIASEGEIEVVE